MYLWHGQISDKPPKELQPKAAKAAVEPQPEAAEPSAAFSDHVSDALLLINTAETPEELAVLPGVGLATAKAILAARTSEFKSLAEVADVPRISKKHWDVDAIARWKMP